MARLPGNYPQQVDGGLGAVAPDADGQRMLVGPCSLGTAGDILTISSVDDVIAKLGVGPLASKAARNLLIGGGTLFAIPSAASTVGVITPAVGNPATPLITLAGTPNAAAQVQVVIVKAGAIGTATFKYSLDGGQSPSPEITTAATFAFPGTPLTATFAVGSYTTGSVYNFGVTAPLATVADITAAVNVALGTDLLFEYIHICAPSDASYWTALETLGVSAENGFRWIQFLCEAGAPLAAEVIADTWVTRIAALKTATYLHLTIVAPWMVVYDPITDTFPIDNIAAEFGGRLSGSSVAESPAYVDGGPVLNVQTVAPYTTGKYALTTTYTAGNALTLDQAGFTAVMRHPGRPGWYWVEGRTAAPITSDFSTIQNRRVMNKATHIVRMAILGDVQAQVDPTDLNTSLTHVKEKALSALGAMSVNREIVSGTVEVPTGQNILATKQLRMLVKLLPFGYAREIITPIAFVNPFQLVPAIAAGPVQAPAKK